MAKSIRASVSKRNRATLRKNFFGPIVDARTERLHAKLQELADKPRPEAPTKSKKELAEDEAGMCITFLSFENAGSSHVTNIDQAAKAQLGEDEGKSTAIQFQVYAVESKTLIYPQQQWMSMPRSLRATRSPHVCKSVTRSLATPSFSRNVNPPAREDPTRSEGFAEEQWIDVREREKKGVWESTYDYTSAIHVHIFHSLCLIYHTF